MTQLELMHESFNDALVATVMALGGYKKVGPVMRPELPVEQAANWLRDCLNPSRREKLNPEQTLLVMKFGRQAGVHAAAAFAMRECGYSDPDPVEPEDEMALLQRAWLEGRKRDEQLVARMERVAETLAGMRRSRR
jgi:hypothetical protein